MPVIGVFWDIENCAVPHGKSALALVQKIREKLFSGKREVEFMCVCDTSKENRDVIQELNYAQVTVVHVHATSKNAADDKLRQSLHRFANAYPPQSTAVLLSGDVNFTSELSDLRYRHQHYVILVHPSSAQEALLSCAHECHSYEELIHNLPCRPPKKAADGSTELLVSGLPRSRSNKALQHRLEILSDNCGGKVTKVFGAQALLKFPNSEAAARAKTRLQEEDVYGAKINVDFAERSQTQGWKKLENSPAYCSPKTRPKNRSVASIQRSHSLSPEPKLRAGSSNVVYYNSSSPHRRRFGGEMGRSSPVRSAVYYGKDCSPRRPGGTQIQDIPEKDEDSDLSKVQSASRLSCVDSATMTHPEPVVELPSSNKSKKKLRVRAEHHSRFRVKGTEVSTKDEANHTTPSAPDRSQSPQKTKTTTTTKTKHPIPLRRSPTCGQNAPVKGELGTSQTAEERRPTESQSPDTEGKTITGGSHRRRKKKKSQSAASQSNFPTEVDGKKQESSNTQVVTTCVYISKHYSREQAGQAQDASLVTVSEIQDEQDNSDVIVEEEEIEMIENDDDSKTKAAGDECAENRADSGQSGSKKVSGSLAECHTRCHSAVADLIIYRSKCLTFDQSTHSSGQLRKGNTKSHSKQGTASPRKLPKPHAIRPKLSPVKYPSAFNSTYFSNAYQCCTPPGDGKFGYYYRRNSYHTSSGYYSHFGSPNRSEIESSQMQDIVDGFNQKRKVSREVLFLQQQVYQNDDWPKSEDEGYEFQEDIEGYCREECHSAPPLPYHCGYHCMTPEKSHYASRGLHFRRTPGAHRPLSRARQFSGERPRSGLSNHSCSSPESYSSCGYPELSSQFRPIKFGMPHLSHTCGDITVEKDGEEQAVELMVSNLDYNISAREWRNILYAEFHQHVQVIDVHIMTQPDNTNIGYIKVPTMEDAKHAISQFHRKKIGYKRIHVTTVNHDDESLANAKTNLITILQEVPNHQLSLYKLMEIYEKRFHHPVTASEIFSFQDVLSIIELEGHGRVVRLLSADHRSVDHDSELTADAPEDLICMVHCSGGTNSYQNLLDTMPVPFVVLQLRSFAAQLHTMLQDHAGSLPLISFPVCYCAEFGSLNIVYQGGVALEHLISSVPGVCIKMTRSGSKHVHWAENRVTALLEHGTFSSNSILSQQLDQFNHEVVMILKSMPQCRMPVGKFLSTYHHLLGKQCRVADYGYTKITELLEAIPHIVQVIGHGSHKFVTLSHHAQVKRFAVDLLRVIKSQTSKQVSATDLPTIYAKVIGKPFDIVDYGLCYLEDMIQELPKNTIAVSGSADDLLFSLPRRDQTPEEIERTKQFGLEVIDLLKHSPQCCIPFNRFIPAYHHHFGKQCRVSDYGFTKLVELFEAIPHVLKIIDEQDDRVLTLVESELLKVLEEQVIALLKSCPDHKLPVPEFLSSFTKFHGHSIRLQDFGVTSVVQLIEKIGKIAQVESQDGKYIIKLVDDTHIRMLAHHVLLLLMEQLDGSMPLETLQERYRHLFGYSVTKMELEQDLKDLIQVTTIGSKQIIKLCPLQMFARDVRTLLRHHHGKLPVSQFECSFANYFGVKLVPASYGYSNTTNLLQAIPHVVQLKGKGFNIMVVLCQDFEGKLYTGPPTLVEQATSPIPLDTGELGTQVSSEIASDKYEAESDLMSLTSACNTPHDLLAARVPSGIPSPELIPTAVLTTGDLIRFDCGAPNDANDVFAELSPEEKRGQKTPLCKTPISDMLQFAARLLPASPCPQTPPSGHCFNYSYPPVSGLGTIFPSSCLFDVPPVPRDAPHVSTLEQQEEDSSHHETVSNENVENEESLLKQLQGGASNNSEPCPATRGSGTACFDTDRSRSCDICSNQHHIQPDSAGGTLFWAKNESSQIETSVQSGSPESSSVTSTAQSSGTDSSTSTVLSAARFPDASDASISKLLPVQDTAAGSVNKSLDAITTKAATLLGSHSDKSDPLTPPSGSPTSSVAERLCRIGIGSCSSGSANSARQRDDQHSSHGSQPLTDSGIDSPGLLSQNLGSGTKEVLNPSTVSTPSPSRKPGTPHRSRLAAKFTTS